MTIRKAFFDWVDDLLGRKNYQRYKEKALRRKRIAGQLMALLTFLCAGGYIVWCFSRANWDLWYAFLPFIFAELAFLGLFALWVSMLWNKRFHPPTGPPQRKFWRVDVFLPVCGEPIEVFEPTLAAAVNLDYPEKTVIVLDDGKDERIRQLAESYGVSYLSRDKRENRKAGNLNFGLRQTVGDLILVLDADQVARPKLIKAIIGYLDYPHIGFVQTAQSFKVPENDPWGNADPVFYQAMQAGKEYANAAISCGSGVIYRREALEMIGGFSTWNLVEDVHTSMLLQEQGWHTVYHDTPYTQGTAPKDVIVHEQQRWQWAVDSLRLLFWDNPFKHRGLSLVQKLQYVHFGYNYLVMGIFLPVFFLLPIWALFTHQFMLATPLWLYVLVRMPYYLTGRITNDLITHHTHSFKAFQAQASLFATYGDAVFTALLSRKRIPQYSVTEKTLSRSGFISRLLRCMPHLMLVGGSAAAILFGLATIRGDLWFLAVNVFWCCWTISLLWRFIVLSLWPRLLMR